MPVGGPRHFSGKPDALGVATEWSCPTCRNKVTGRRLEEGCPHCGMGTSPLDQLAEAAPEDGPADAKLLQRTRLQPQGRRDQPLDEPILKFGEQPGQEEPTRARPFVGRATPPAAVDTTKVYRLIEYTSTPGQEQALDDVLRRALVGTVGFAWGSIVAAIVDEVSTRQQDILNLAKRQPGVWLGGPPPRAAEASLPEIWRQHMGSLEHSPFSGKAPMAGSTLPPDHPAPPDQGPSFTNMQALLAKVLVQQAGLTVAYTVALALQNFAQLADQEAMEPEKILRGDQCLALANAIMQEIPDTWAPDAAAPGEGPTTEES